MYTNAAGMVPYFPVICLSGTSINHQHPKPSFITWQKLFREHLISVLMKAASLDTGSSENSQPSVSSVSSSIPADIPSTHKDEVYKTDTRDARGMGQALANGRLRGIYVPPLNKRLIETSYAIEKKSGAILFVARTV
jgi:hypothetical protein